MTAINLNEIKGLEGGKIVITTISDNETVNIVNVNNMYCLVVSRQDKVISITRVTRKYLRDVFKISDTSVNNDILYPTLLTTIREQFWVHGVEDPCLAITMSYLIGCDPIPTIKE